MAADRPTRVPDTAEATPGTAGGAAGRSRVHRVAGGMALVAAPLLLVLGEAALLQVRGSGDPLEVIGAAVPAWQAGQLAMLLWSAALVPAALTIRRLLTDRAPGWADAGAVLVVAGALAGLALAAVNLVIGEMARIGPGADLRQLLDRVSTLASPLDQLGQARLLGLLVLAIGLYRAAAAPPWLVTLLLTGLAIPWVAVAAQFVTGAAWLSGAGWLLAAVLQLAALGWLSRTLLRGNDDVWDHPPAHPPFTHPGRFAAAMIAVFLPGAALSLTGFAAWVLVVLALAVYKPAAPGDDPPSVTN